jgi:hypothetical protein
VGFSIRAFREADRAALVELWARVFQDDPPRNAPAAMIDKKLQVQPELLLVGEVDETAAGGWTLGRPEPW